MQGACGDGSPEANRLTSARNEKNSGPQGSILLVVIGAEKRGIEDG